MSGRKTFAYICFLIIVIGSNIGEITAYREILSIEHHSRTSLASLFNGGNLLSVENVNASNTGTDLADTVRVDPLDNLKKYRGGFDVRNEHYWSSTAFTGIYGYAIGVFWLLSGALFGAYLLATSCCCTKRKNNKLKKRVHSSRQCYLWPIIIVASLTFLAIIVSGVVIGGTTKFNSRVKTVLDIIIDTTEGAATTIYNVTGAMRDVRDNVATSGEADQVFTFLGSTSRRLDTEAAELSRQARKNRRLINTVLKVIYITSTVIISINLVLVTALCVSGFIRLRKIFYTLIILCWIMAALCWVYFGLYFFLDKFTGDTCTALKDFQQDPFNNSLSEILPCDELASAGSVLLDTRVGISDLINEVNRNLSTTYGQLIKICNPFSAAPEYNYEPENCSSGTIRIGDIPQVIQGFTCTGGENATCGEGQFISRNDFQTVEGYTRSIQNLLDALPGMESLIDCQIVKDAFATIISKHCKPVNKYVTMVWASMIVLSTMMVILLLAWTVNAFQERRSQYADGSVKPHSTIADTLDTEEGIGSVDKSNHTLDP